MGDNPKVTSSIELGKQSTQENLFVGIKQVVQKLGIPITTIRRWENKGIMPKSVRFVPKGPRFWKKSEIKSWVTTLDIPATIVQEIHQVLDSK